ncbi:MAG TPA: ABC-F family ATP-binding cassette domain-containing protein [Candidatus Dormibacteraeota bacterium]|nr:ABC-F family ATP-binding cassette domain-containing protein [Candidatus Dormibacteraeota bacterium]
MLQATELTVEVAARAVVRDGSFLLRDGDKVGLVGRNGAGKTSLLKVLGGEVAPASGVVLTRGSLGYVPQDPRPDPRAVDATALTRLLGGRDLDILAGELEAARLALETDHSETSLHRFSHAEEVFRDAGGYSGESDARRIAAGLGVLPDRVDLPLRVLSGGERRRIELGRALFAEASVLLLDEPTNHLDKDAKEWLMGFLRGHRGALLVVSHDLDLLDTAITRVLHLENAKLTEYRGTYTQYQAARRADEKRLSATADRQQAEINRLQTLADVMRRQTAKRAKTAKSLDKRVERLRSSAVTVERRGRKVRFRFPPPPHSGRIVLQATGLSKGYGGPAVFTDVGFQLEKGQRLLIMGYNGAGKSSLLRILAGTSKADSGSFRTGVGVSLGYYAQEHEGLDPKRTVLDHMRDASDADDPVLRQIVGMFGLTGDKAFQPAGTLSGGEKTKLALAQLGAGRHNLLVLDEPTNNLDPPSRDAFAEALNAWPGSLVVVSHDAEFVDRLSPQKILLMPEGINDFWDDDFLGMVSLA